MVSEAQVPSSVGGEEANDSRSRVADVAELYWVKGLKVEAVGRELGISRSTVSRLLARAREEHVIEFRVHREINSAGALRQALSVKYGIDIAIPQVGENADEQGRRYAVGKEAAVWLNALLRPHMVIAVSWGRTVEAMSSQLRRQHLEGIDIVQMHGSGNVSTLGKNYAGQILERFGNAFDGEVHLLPVPAVFDSAETLTAMRREASVKSVLELRAGADLLISSVGTPNGNNPGRLYASGYFSQQDIKDLAQNDTIGNIASVFFRSDGSTDGIPVNDRSTGMSFDELRAVKSRLFVVDDPLKTEATHALLRAGLITHLVVDPMTARALLDA